MTNHTATKDAKCYFCDFKSRHDNVKRHMHTNHANAMPAGHRPFRSNPKILLREQTTSVRDNTTQEMVDVVQFPDGICTGCYTRISNIREDGWRKLINGSMLVFQDHRCKPKQQRVAREVTLMAPPKAPKAPKAAAKEESDNESEESINIPELMNNSHKSTYDKFIECIDSSPDLSAGQKNRFINILENNKYEDEDGNADYIVAVVGGFKDLIKDVATRHLP